MRTQSTHLAAVLRAVTIGFVFSSSAFAQEQPAQPVPPTEAAPKAETAPLTVPTPPPAPATTSAPSTPARGTTMTDVRSKFGAPTQEGPAVGTPPITRWDYPGYAVFFEHDRVLHTVVARS